MKRIIVPLALVLFAAALFSTGAAPPGYKLVTMSGSDTTGFLVVGGFEDVRFKTTSDSVRVQVFQPNRSTTATTRYPSKRFPNYESATDTCYPLFAYTAAEPWNEYFDMSADSISVINDHVGAAVIYVQWR